MKILTAALFSFVSFGSLTQAFAEDWFAVDASARPVQYIVSVQVFNQFGGPITCRGFIYGDFMGSGSTFRHFENLTINPGEYGSVQLVSRELKPFRNGRADVECKLI